MAGASSSSSCRALQFAKVSTNRSRLRPSTFWRSTENASGSSSTTQSSFTIWRASLPIAEETKLTRSTIASILQDISVAVFRQYKTNPEDFILKAARLINEQKATVIVEHLTYDPVDDAHSSDIFTQEKPKEDFSNAMKANRHIYDYVFTDSKNERKFVKELDSSTEVVVYAKLPKSFFIPTPVGTYNPDWAIAFEDGKVKHVYFIAETKGSMSSMELRKIEECKIDCARKFFAKITSEQVKYDVVDSYGKLMELVQ